MPNTPHLSSLREKHKHGFTLVELMIVIAIIGLLAVALLPKLTGAQANARDTRRKADLAQISAGLQSYKTDRGSYPSYTPGDPSSSMPIEGCASNKDGKSALWLEEKMDWGKIPRDPNEKQQAGICSESSLGRGVQTGGAYVYANVRTKKGTEDTGFVLMAHMEQYPHANATFEGQESWMWKYGGNDQWWTRDFDTIQASILQSWTKMEWAHDILILYGSPAGINHNDYYGVWGQFYGQVALIWAKPINQQGGGDYTFEYQGRTFSGSSPDTYWETADIYIGDYQEGVQNGLCNESYLDDGSHPQECIVLGPASKTTTPGLPTDPYQSRSFFLSQRGGWQNWNTSFFRIDNHIEYDGENGGYITKTNTADLLSQNQFRHESCPQGVIADGNWRQCENLYVSYGGE